MAQTVKCLPILHLFLPWNSIKFRHAKSYIQTHITHTHAYTHRLWHTALHTHCTYPRPRENVLHTWAIVYRQRDLGNSHDSQEMGLLRPSIHAMLPTTWKRELEARRRGGRGWPSAGGTLCWLERKAAGTGISMRPRPDSRVGAGDPGAWGSTGGWDLVETKPYRCLRSVQGRWQGFPFPTLFLALSTLAVVINHNLSNSIQN